jgi:hypothetical protein
VMAGEEGFEPSNAGIKIRCLRPTWRLPYTGAISYQKILKEQALRRHRAN